MPSLIPCLCIYEHWEWNKKCRLWIDEILTTKVKQLVLLWWKASLYTEEMPLYKVKQVVLLKQKGSDTFNLSITMPNMLVFNMLKQEVILFSKMIIFFWSNYQHSFYNLIWKLIIYKIIYSSSFDDFVAMSSCSCMCLLV